MLVVVVVLLVLVVAAGVGVGACDLSVGQVVRLVLLVMLLPVIWHVNVAVVVAGSGCYSCYYCFCFLLFLF